MTPVPVFLVVYLKLLDIYRASFYANSVVRPITYKPLVIRDKPIERIADVGHDEKRLQIRLCDESVPEELWDSIVLPLMNDSIVIDDVVHRKIDTPEVTHKHVDE